MSVEGMGAPAAAPESSAPAQESAPQYEGSSEQQSAPAQQHDDATARRLEIIAKREREFMSRENQWREEMRSKQEMERRLHELEAREKLFEVDPMSYLNQRGWDVNKLAERISSVNEPIAGQEKQQLYGKLEEVTNYVKKLENELKLRDEKQTEQARSSVKRQLMNDLQGIAKQNPDKYELIQAEGAYDTVFEVLDDYYTQHGKPLEYTEAMDLVENYLVKQYEKALKYNKIKSKFAPVEESASFEEYQRQPETSYQPRTLTNDFSQTTPPQSTRPLTREESLKRAAALIRFDD